MKKLLLFFLFLILTLSLNAMELRGPYATSGNIAGNLPDNVVLDNEANTFTETQTFANVTADVGEITTVNATSVAGTLSTAAQTNITSVGSLADLTIVDDLIVDTNDLYVDAGSNFVGMGTTTAKGSNEGFSFVGINFSINRSNNNPSFVIRRDDSSVEAGNPIGGITYKTTNSIGTDFPYVGWAASVVATTNGSEQGSLVLTVQNPGTDHTITFGGDGVTINKKLVVGDTLSAGAATFDGAYFSATVTGGFADFYRSGIPTVRLTNTGPISNGSQISGLHFQGDDSALNETAYVRLDAFADVTANNSEEGRLDVLVRDGGGYDTIASFQDDLVVLAGALTLGVATSSVTVTTSNTNLAVVVGGITYYLKAHTSQ